MSRNEVFIFGFRGFPEVQGGIETHVQHLAPRLVARGHPRHRLHALALCAR
ncbi:MAG: hypothetical protein MZV49_01655 [Rhodopseudomonas palustris]|nr:hypothetical protein [Rhodopseudomonas palustris]